MIPETSFFVKLYGELIIKKVRIYAGIGSRETPVPILNVMRRFATAVAKDHILRTGGAPGADDAFFVGAKNWCISHKVPLESRIEVFLPWDNFNGYKSSRGKYIYLNPPTGASLIAEKFHPNYNKLKDSNKKLMDRNSQQIMGRLLNDSVDFVVCYTSDGKASGGTGQALRIAEYKEIPIYNLFHKEAYFFCMEKIEEMDFNKTPINKKEN